MAKKPSSLKNMLIALFVITAVSGGLLGLVYGLTKDAIAEVELQKNEKAIKEVLPLGEGITYTADTITLDDNGVTLSFPCNLARDANGTLLGAAIKTTEGGFGGNIELMVGITTDGIIKGVSVLSHSETPGLGANMEGKFKDQFADKKPGDNIILEVTKSHDGKKVDAITAATITSKAFTKAVDNAFKAFESNKSQLQKGGQQ